MIKTSVYIMRCGDFMKVGMASSVNRRLDSIRAANPYHVEVIWSLELCDKKSASVAERATHRKLKNLGFHHKLEWFLYSEEAFSEAVREVTDHEKRDYASLYKRIDKIRSIVRSENGIGTTAIYNHLISAGFKEEAKAVRKGHYGPYASFEVTEDGVTEAESFANIGERA